MQNAIHGAKIIAGIVSGRVLTGPQSVQLSLVDSCNYRCIMCWEHSSELDGWGADDLAREYHARKRNKSKSMDFDMYRRFVDSLAGTGARKLTFAGIGEPLLHPRVVEAVAYAKSRGMTLWITTNGSMLTRELMEGLAEAGLDDLCVSINSGTPEDYALIHKNQESSRFDEITQNLAWLKGYKDSRSLDHPRLTLSNVINRFNCDHAMEMMESGVQAGAVRVSYRPMGPFPLTEQFMMDSGQLGRLRSTFVKVQELAVKHGIETDIPEFDNLIALREDHALTAPCFAGWLFPFVLANGDVTFCCASREVVGNLADSSFESIWFSPERQKLNRAAVHIHKTQQAVPKSRCFGCEQTLANLRIYRRLRPLFGKPVTNESRTS